MTELEQLKADLATHQASMDLLRRQGCPNIALGVQSICELIKKNIAKLEPQQTQVDPHKEAKYSVKLWEADCDEDSDLLKVAKYVKHLESKVVELAHELRCERIDGGKVRDDRKAISAERLREKLAELTMILNSIPPACGEAMELVKRRIESVKKEMQGNG